MIVLGVETSGRHGAIALLRDTQCLAHRSLDQPGRRHAQTLVSEVQILLKHQQLRPGDVELVAVSIGPGSFTGLRVGAVFAKTFAYATGANLVAVDTLQAIAAQSPADVSQVHIIADAQRGELFWGHYQRELSGAFRRDSEIRIIPAETWLPTLQNTDVLAGPALEKFAGSSLPCRVLSESAQPPQADTVARIGLQEFLAGNRADCWSLEPFYLRRSAAEEKADRPAG